MSKSGTKILSLLLAAAMVFTMLPMTAFAEGEIPLGDSGNPATPTDIVIAAFDELDEYTLYQGYDAGTVTLNDLDLPENLTGTDADGNAVTIDGVTWESAPDFDPAVEIPFPGYIFTPTLPEGYILADGATAPVITVFIRPEGGVGIMPLAATGTMDVGGQMGVSLASNTSGTAWSWDASTNTLDIYAPYENAPIKINCQLTDTINLVYHGNVGVSRNDADTQTSAIHCLGNLIISEGQSGRLTMSAFGNGFAGIRTDGDLTINSGDVRARGPSGIYAEGAVNITGSARVEAGPLLDQTGYGIRIRYTDDLTIDTTGEVHATAHGESTYAIYMGDGKVIVNNSTIYLWRRTSTGTLLTSTRSYIRGTLENNGGTFFYNGVWENDGDSIPGRIISSASGAVNDLNQFYVSLSYWSWSPPNMTLTLISDVNYFQFYDINDINFVIQGSLASSNWYRAVRDERMTIGKVTFRGGELTVRDTGVNWDDAAMYFEGGFEIDGAIINVITAAPRGGVHITSGDLTIPSGALNIDLSGSDTSGIIIDDGNLDISGTASVSVKVDPDTGSGVTAGEIRVSGGSLNVGEAGSPNDVYGNLTVSGAGASVTINGDIDGDLTVTEGTVTITGTVTGTTTHTGGTLNGNPPSGDTAAPTPGNSGTITATNVAQTALALNWTKAADDVSAQSALKYYVYRSTSGNIGTAANCAANGTLINAGGMADIAALNMTGLTANTIYYFNVVVEDEAGNKAAYTMMSQTTATAPTYLVTVNSGTGGGSYAQGATVTITAGTAPSEERFKEWNISPAVTFTDGTSKSSQTAKFTMPAQAVTATATYESIPVGTTSVSGIALNRTSLSLYSNTSPNTATLAATVSPADATDKSVTWTSGNTAVATVDQSGNVTAVGNGTAAITVTTTDGGYTASCTVTVSTYSGGGGGGGTTTTTPPSTVTGDTVTPQVTTDSQTGVTSASVTSNEVNTALDNAKAAAKAGENPVVVIDISAPADAATVQTTIPSAAFGTIRNSVNTDLTIQAGSTTLTFSDAALSGITGVGDVVITAGLADPSDLNAKQRELVGDRPVYDFSVTVGGEAITDFGGGVSVSVPYTPAAGENPNAIVVYYIDAQGNVQTIQNGVYDSVTGMVSFTTDHFSLYMIGYNLKTFTDTGSHWAADSITFVTARGLFSGTGSNQFSPDGSMTRAMFATVLARLDGADLSGYTSSRFSDVPTGQYYSAAVEWAADKGIITGAGNGKFDPNANITREQMAVMLANYAKYKGYTLPTGTVSAFDDESKIASWAKDAVKSIQAAGTIGGKPGNVFDPQGTATRGEVATIFARFIEVLAK